MFSLLNSALILVFRGTGTLHVQWYQIFVEDPLAGCGPGELGFDEGPTEPINLRRHCLPSCRHTP